MALCILFIQYNTTLLVIYVQFDGYIFIYKDIGNLFLIHYPQFYVIIQ